MRQPIAVGLIAALLCPGPLSAQTIRGAIPGRGAAAPTGATAGRAPSAVPATPSISLSAPSGPALPATPGLPSVAGPSAAPAAATTPAGTLALPAAAVSAAGLPAAAPGPVSRSAAPDGPVAGGTRNLGEIQAALDGDAAAGRARPGLRALGSPAAGPAAHLDETAQSALAAEFFNLKSGVEQGIEAEDGDLLGFEPWATVPEWGRKPSKKKGDGPVEVPDPKYPARDIRFKDHVFPSNAMRPDRPIEPLLVQAIDAAEESIHIAMYEFKLREVLKALRRAKAKGVKIHIIMDYSNAFPRKRPGSDYTPHRSMELQALINEGFDVTIVRGMWRYGIQHNKFMVFDGQLAEFGSYNYTYTAENNHFENANFTDKPEDIQALLAYWSYIREHSVPFDRARDHAWPKERPKPPTLAPSVPFNGILLPRWVFSPDNGAEDWIVKAIDAANESLDVSMFTLRSTRIAEALLRAKRDRKLKVRVILDRSQSETDTVSDYADWLAFHKIPVRILAGPNPDGPQFAEKDHNKFLVADGKLVETGSMNFTKNATKMSFENSHYTADPVDAAAYQAFFNDMWKMGLRHPAPGRAPKLPADEDLLEELLVEPEPVPPPPVWGKLPDPGSIRFNGETFPRAMARPHDPIRDTLVKAIRTAEKSIRIAVYEFNIPEILEALREQKAKGRDIEVLIDYLHVFPRGNNHAGELRQRSPQIQALIDEGFTVRIVRGRSSTGTMHNKFAIFDGKMLEFGSFNWAVTAEENHFETISFTDEKERLEYYERYWNYMWDLSQEVKDSDDYDWSANKPGPAPVDTDLALDLNGAKFPRSAASPGGGVEAILIKAILAARSTIDIAMFSFYSKAIAEALLVAKNENKVKIRLGLDENQSKLMKLDEWFSYHGFDVHIVAGPNDDGNVMFEKQHNKFMVIDGKFLEAGSFNYTPNAENNNFDNANFFTDAATVAFYAAAFQVLYDKGWAPRRPKRPPLNKATPQEFFAALQSLVE